MRLRAAIALAIISNQCSVFVKLESCSLQQDLQQYITNYNTTSTRVRVNDKLYVKLEIN